MIARGLPEKEKIGHEYLNNINLFVSKTEPFFNKSRGPFQLIQKLMNN